MARFTPFRLTTIYLLSFSLSRSLALSASLNAARATELFTRASDSCGDPGLTACNAAGLPTNFCCQSGTTCISFNNAASAICCPQGHDCQQISPITCDLTQQNVTLYPSSPIHSTNLSGNLQQCGTGNACCPQGYTCQNGQCNMNKPASSSSSSSSSASSSAPSKTASASSASSTTTGTTAAATTSSKPTTAPEFQPVASKFSAIAVIAGFFPGVLVGALLAILFIICLGRLKAKASRKNDEDFGRVSATVSDPIYQPQYAARTDFLRRESRTRNRASSRVKSLFAKSPKTQRFPVTPPDSIKYPGTDTIGGVSRRTPEVRKEPSMESIEVYSPPNVGLGGGLGRPTTTFSDMMAQSGLKEGVSYLGSPGMVDPRSRRL